MTLTFRDYFILILLCFALFLPGITSLPILDRDSARFSQATKQMIETKDYTQIRFQTKPRHRKPPGYYWWQAVFVKAVGQQPFNQVWFYRLASLVGGLLAVLFCALSAGTLLNKQTTLLAASLLASSLLLVFEAHITTTDACLLATIMAMQGALWHIYQRTQQNMPISNLLIIIFWIAMILGILIKGIAPLFAMTTIAALCLWDKNIKLLRAIKPMSGILITLLISLSWIIMLSMASHRNFLLDMISIDLLPKIVSGHESHGAPPGYYLVLITLAFWPGSLFLWQGILWSWQQRQHQTIRFLIAWAMPTWLLLEMVPTKLPQYLLPIIPAVALLVANGLIHFQHIRYTTLSRFFTRLHYTIWFVYTTALVIGLFYLPHHLGLTLSIYTWLTASILIIILLTTCYLLPLKRYHDLAYTLMIGAVIFYGLVFKYYLPQLTPVWITETVVTQLQNNPFISKQTPLISIGYQEPSLVFRLGTQHVLFTNTASIIDLIKDNKKHYLLVDDAHMNALQNIVDTNQLSLTPISKFRGFLYSKGHSHQYYIYIIKQKNEHQKNIL